jgi:hypothetical protein
MLDTAGHRFDHLDIVVRGGRPWPDDPNPPVQRVTREAPSWPCCTRPSSRRWLAPRGTCRAPRDTRRPMTCAELSGRAPPVRLVGRAAADDRHRRQVDGDRAGPRRRAGPGPVPPAGCGPVDQAIPARRRAQLPAAHCRSAHERQPGQCYTETGPNVAGERPHSGSVARCTASAARSTASKSPPWTLQLSGLGSWPRRISPVRPPCRSRTRVRIDRR